MEEDPCKKEEGNILSREEKDAIAEKNYVYGEFCLLFFLLLLFYILLY
jgi:hypothetical protein